MIYSIRVLRSGHWRIVATTTDLETAREEAARFATPQYPKSVFAGRRMVWRPR